MSHLGAWPNQGMVVFVFNVASPNARRCAQGGPLFALLSAGVFGPGQVTMQKKPSMRDGQVSPRFSCTRHHPNTRPPRSLSFPDRQRQLKRRLGGAAVYVNNSVFAPKGV
jgi:hypothetical protein